MDRPALTDLPEEALLSDLLSIDMMKLRLPGWLTSAIKFLWSFCSISIQFLVSQLLHIHPLGIFFLCLEMEKMMELHIVADLVTFCGLSCSYSFSICGSLISTQLFLGDDTSPSILEIFQAEVFTFRLPS